MIKAKTHGRIFMPLYQQQGEDGFFLIRIIHPVFYKLSAWLRSKHADRFLVWLPGVNWYNQEKSALVINKQIARFFARQFFHLLGYRSIERGEKYLIAYNREAKARYEDYKDAPWMN